jgi:hypothetical protein
MILSSTCEESAETIFASGGAMKHSRMRRPAAVRRGMFCWLGSFEDSLPVTAVVCE